MVYVTSEAQTIMYMYIVIKYIVLEHLQRLSCHEPIMYWKQANTKSASDLSPCSAWKVSRLQCVTTILEVLLLQWQP